MPASLIFPAATGVKPSDLFSNTSTKTPQTDQARFVSKTAGGEYLIFISSFSATEDEAPHRTVYAIVWGPHEAKQKVNHQVHDFCDDDDKQTAERAQLVAAMKAIVVAADMKWKNPSVSSVVLAYQGDYFRNQVAHSSMEKELRGKRDNLDLKFKLFEQVKEAGSVGLTIQFWQVETDNRAEGLAVLRLYGPTHWTLKAVKGVVNLT